jgi:CHAT domain-containing protein
MLSIQRVFVLCLIVMAAWCHGQNNQNEAQHADYEKRARQGGDVQVLREWVDFTLEKRDNQVFDRLETAIKSYLTENERLNQKDERYAEGLICLGRVYSASAQKERGLKALTDALAINETFKASNPTGYLRNLNFIVKHCNDHRFYNPQIEKYFDLFAQEYPKQQEDPDVYLPNLMELVRHNTHTGQPEKSIPIVDGALVYVEQKLGKNSQEYTMFKTFRSSLSPGGMSKKEEKQFLEAAGMDEGFAEANEVAAYLQKGDIARAAVVLDKYMGAIQKAYFNQKNYARYVDLLCTMVMYYRETGNLNKAYELLQTASTVAKQYVPNDADVSVQVLSSEGDFFKEMGNDARAEGKYLEALKVLDAARTEKNQEKNDEQYYDVLGKLGAVYRHWGYNRDAHQNFLDVAGYMRNKFGENSMEYAKALIPIADVCEGLNLVGRSEWYFKRALAMIKKNAGENSPAYISGGEQYGSLLVRLGRYSEAEPYLMASRTLYQGLVGSKGTAYLNSTSDLAFQYVFARNYAKAQPLFKELIDNNLYRIQNFFPSLSEAEKGTFYRRAYADINAFNIYACRFGATNKEEAGTMYNVQLSTKGLLFRSTNRVKETILNSKDDSLKATYNKWLESKEMLSRIYQMTPQQKASEKINEKAWEERVNLLERKLTKQSELFSNLLITAPTWKSIQQKLAPGEAAVEIVKLIEPRYEYVYWKQDKGFGYDSLNTGEWSVYNIDCDRTPAHKAGVRTRDVIVSINGTALKGKTGEEVETLYRNSSIELVLKRDGGAPFKATVKDDSVFYINMIRRTRYVALILTPETKSGPELVTLENGDDLENRYGRYYQNAIKQKLEDPYSYNQFWKPIQAKLTGIKKVYFSPDGVYNFMNPSTFFNPATKKYLLDELEIAVVNNTSDILTVRPKGNLKKATLIGFPEYNKKNNGPQGQVNLSSDVDYRAITSDSTSTRFMSGSVVSELPGTKVEVNGIESILQRGQFEVTKLMMTDATEERVKTLHSPDILHIATHGFFMNELSGMTDAGRGITGVTAQKLSQNPLLRSGLLLAGAGHTIAKGKDDNAREDGILTAYEAMNLDLQNTELVVLSACETGLGQLKNGEGVYGLNRAFRAAGAKSVLMSLWKVDDQATQQLMTEFYNAWLKGDSKGQAFRKAQLKLREKYSHPYYWGAFLAVGE